MNYLGYGGIALGTILAIVISFNVNKSILWAIINGFFEWFYMLFRQ